MNGQDTRGTEELCFWPIGGDATRIQTRNPAIAVGLRRLKNTREVGYSVAGGYLRLFDSTQPLAELRKALNEIEKNVAALAVEDRRQSYLDRLRAPHPSTIKQAKCRDCQRQVTPPKRLCSYCAQKSRKATKREAMRKWRAKPGLAVGQSANLEP
jgi:hypothetical protein